MVRFFATQVLVWSALLTMGSVVAQDSKPNQTSPEVIRVDFKKLIWSIAWEDGEQPRVQVKQTLTRAETRTRMVPVQRMRMETRTRTVKKNGKDVEVDYTVTVPFVEQVEQTFTVEVPRDESVDLPIDQLDAMTADGKKLSTEQLTDRLKGRTPMFLIDQPWVAGRRLDPLQAAVLRPETLIVFPKKAAE